MPARGEGAGVVRRAFVPKRGAFSAFDYQQIEPRLFGYYVSKGLGDTTVADWFREGRDFYKEIAGRVYAKAADEVTDAERQQGKVWFLMTLYSAGPRKISEATGMPYAEAKAFYLQFHERFPQIKALSNPPPPNWRADYVPGMIERTLKRRSYLKTPWGRHLHPEQWGEHKMLNKLIQGSAADLMKLAIIRVNQALLDEAESRLVLTVHDELVIDGPESEIDLLHEHVPRLMTSVPEITEVVPLGVDHEVSLTNLAEKISYETWKESVARTAA